MSHLYPLKDEDIVPGEWTHSRGTCQTHGDDSRFARDHFAPHLPPRCVQCMRKKQLTDEKPTNPKDQAAVDRAPVGLVPGVALLEESMAWFEGLLKYGAHNYAIKGIRSSVYVFAAGRHILKWWFGQQRDSVTRVHHLGSARACLGAILDAEHRGKLEDDRPPALPHVDEMFDRLTETMRHLVDLYGDRKPRHYTIADTELPGTPSKE
jgi:hypothetical protein